MCFKILKIYLKTSSFACVRVRIPRIFARWKYFSSFFFLLKIQPRIYILCVCTGIYILVVVVVVAAAAAAAAARVRRFSWSCLSLSVVQKKANVTLLTIIYSMRTAFFLLSSLSLYPCSFSLFESYRLHLLLPRCEIFSRIASFHSVERLAVQLVQVPQRVDVCFVILVHHVFRNRVVSVRFLSNL